MNALEIGVWIVLIALAGWLEESLRRFVREARWRARVAKRTREILCAEGRHPENATSEQLFMAEQLAIAQLEDETEGKGKK